MPDPVAKYVPSPDQIEEATAEIRAMWDSTTRSSRFVGQSYFPAETPFVSAMLLFEHSDDRDTLN